MRAQLYVAPLCNGGKVLNMGRGSSKSGAGSVGEKGTGVKVTFQNGKTVSYFVASDGLRDIITGSKTPITGPTKQAVQNMIKNGNATFLSKSDVNKLRKQRNAANASKPDYELNVGTGWGRGAGKTVYRPRRGS